MSTDPKRLIQRAIRRSELGNHTEALNLLDQAIQISPNDPEPHHERAMVRLEMGRKEVAVLDFERALELNPRYPGARQWLARTLAGLHDHRRSAEHWLRNLRDEPNGPPGMGVSPQCWADCAEQFRLAGDTSRAIELLEEYFAVHVNGVKAYACYETAPMRLLAALYADRGEHAQANSLRQRARASPHRVPADA